MSGIIVNSLNTVLTSNSKVAPQAAEHSGNTGKKFWDTAKKMDPLAAGAVTEAKPVTAASKKRKPDANETLTPAEKPKKNPSR